MKNLLYLVFVLSVISCERVGGGNDLNSNKNEFEGTFVLKDADFTYNIKKLDSINYEIISINSDGITRKEPALLKNDTLFIYNERVYKYNNEYDFISSFYFKDNILYEKSIGKYSSTSPKTYKYERE